MNTRSISSAALAVFAGALVIACSSSTTTPTTSAADASTHDGSSGMDASAAVDSAAGGGDSATPVDSSAAGDAAVGDAGGDPGCSPIANTAPTVTDTFMSNVPTPVGTGGAIVDGTYHMTAHVGYMGSSTTVRTHSFTFKFTGSAVDISGHDDNDAGNTARFTLTSNSATGAASMIGSCPAMFVGKKLGAIDSYTATATEVRFYESTKKYGVTFTKQ